jgi:hypothetical protein
MKIVFFMLVLFCIEWYEANILTIVMPKICG